MPLIVGPAIRNKLATRHDVSIKELEECFENREGRLLLDTREKNQTDPPTQWFIAETNHLRPLKVVFVQRGKDVFIRTAYEPSEEENRIYRKYGLNDA